MSVPIGYKSPLGAHLNTKIGVKESFPLDEKSKARFGRRL